MDPDRHYDYGYNPYGASSYGSYGSNSELEYAGSECSYVISQLSTPRRRVSMNLHPMVDGLGIYLSLYAPGNLVSISALRLSF